MYKIALQSSVIFFVNIFYTYIRPYNRNEVLCPVCVPVLGRLQAPANVVCENDRIDKHYQDQAQISPARFFLFLCNLDS